MSEKFVCSDLHFCHKNIITFVDDIGERIRPFESAFEHDETLINNWNKTVSPNDKVYVLGDVAINKKGLPLLERLNGKKCLIMGNHDIFGANKYLKYFYDVRACRVMKDPKFIMTHIPISSDQLGRFRVNVHGHLHYRNLSDPRYINVSMEQINFTPLSFTELYEKINSISGV